MFRPCIDLHSGKVKQIVGSTLDGAKATENFVSDKPPAHFASLYRDAGLRGGHVIMLGSGNDELALEALRAFPQGMQVGGGITPDNAQKFLDAGASHVIVTSYVFVDGKLDDERLAKLTAKVPRQRLVLDLSCRRKPDHPADDGFYVVTDRWQRFTDLRVDKQTLARLAEFCDEFLVHGVDVEGKRQGILDDLVEQLGEQSPIKVTYAGGVRSLEDMDRVVALGKGRVDVSVGSALDIFGGDLQWTAVVAWCGAGARKRPRVDDDGSLD